jgi:hypothetical protein
VIAGGNVMMLLCIKFKSMKCTLFTLTLSLLIALTACTKKDAIKPVSSTPISSETTIIELNNREVTASSGALTIDVTQDGRYDLIVGTQLVGDPLYRVDKLQFLVTSSFYTNLAVNRFEQSPVLNHSDAITAHNMQPYEWYNASQIQLMQRSNFVNGDIRWDGLWLQRNRKYLPFQVTKNDGVYTGWLELTTDYNRQSVIVHRAGIHKQPNTTIYAGL